MVVEKSLLFLQEVCISASQLTQRFIIKSVLDYYFSGIQHCIGDGCHRIISTEGSGITDSCCIFCRISGLKKVARGLPCYIDIDRDLRQLFSQIVLLLRNFFLLVDFLNKVNIFVLHNDLPLTSLSFVFSDWFA